MYSTTRYLFPHKMAHLTATSAQSPALTPPYHQPAYLTPPYHQPAHLTPPYHQPAHLTSLPTPRKIVRKCLATCATPLLNARRSLPRPAWRSPWRS